MVRAANWSGHVLSARWAKMVRMVRCSLNSARLDIFPTSLLGQGPQRLLSTGGVSP